MGNTKGKGNKAVIDAAIEARATVYVMRAASADLVERALEAGGDKAIEWAIERKMRSPYSFDYWLGTAAAVAGLGTFNE